MGERLDWHTFSAMFVGVLFLFWVFTSLYCFTSPRVLAVILADLS